jgi:hypothetical protein
MPFAVMKRGRSCSRTVDAALTSSPGVNECHDAGHLIDLQHCSVIQPSWRRFRLQGTEREVVERECAMLQWLTDIGAFLCGKPRSFHEAVALLQDGTALAGVVGRLLSRPVPGILHRPCTAETRLANKRKCALSCLESAFLAHAVRESLCGVSASFRSLCGLGTRSSPDHAVCDAYAWHASEGCTCT